MSGSTWIPACARRSTARARRGRQVRASTSRVPRDRQTVTPIAGPSPLPFPRRRDARRPRAPGANSGGRLVDHVHCCQEVFIAEHFGSPSAARQAPIGALTTRVCASSTTAPRDLWTGRYETSGPRRYARSIASSCRWRGAAPSDRATAAAGTAGAALRGAAQPGRRAQPGPLSGERPTPGRSAARSSRCCARGERRTPPVSRSVHSVNW